MSRIVLDSSAVLALLYEEPGAATVEAMLHSEAAEVVISAVNLCEVHTRLMRDGANAAETSRLLASLNLTVVPFEEADAYLAGELSNKTRAFGLSLGDRACLVLAEKTNATAWTADRAWKKVKLNTVIELIRI